MTWILFVTLLGPLAYFRFDMAPAVLAGAGALLARRRPALAGALIAFGAALKLWPALLVLPLLGVDRKARALGHRLRCHRRLCLALSSLAVGGWQRLLSPLSWQSDRGLQVESLAASPLMWLRTAQDGGGWIVGLSRYNAYEIVGPGVADGAPGRERGNAPGLLPGDPHRGPGGLAPATLDHAAWPA